MISPRRGVFITFEGTEGSGKSTQMRMLAARLAMLGFTVVENQEPGGTSIGKQIRRILLDPANSGMAPMTELLLMFASRTQAAKEVICPALARGEIVLSDRFTDSTLAYQGHARELGSATVEAAHRLALGDLVPDLTIAVEVDLETGLARAARRNRDTAGMETRLDSQPVVFHRSVLEGYRAIAAREPQRFRLVNGTGTPEEVAARVWAEVEPLLTR